MSPSIDDPLRDAAGFLGPVPGALESLPLFTMPRFIGMSNNLSLISAVGYGIRAQAQFSTTVTKMGFCTSSTTPASLTAVYFAICDANGVPLAQTSDVHASITAPSTLYTPDASPGTQIAGLALTSGLAITAGTSYYLGIFWTGTTLGVKGMSGQGVVGDAVGGSPVLNRSKTSYDGSSTLPTLSTVGSVSPWPWIIAY